MVNFLKVLFSVVFVWMCYEVVDTCLHHNLFKEWDYLGGIAWMRATLWDFYANILIIYVWICYKEKSWATRGLWFVLILALGNLAVASYMLIKLSRLKPKDGIKEFLTRTSV